MTEFVSAAETNPAILAFDGDHSPLPTRPRRILARAGDRKGVAAIMALLNSRCPSAIRPLVVSIVIDSVKSHALRSFAHIGEEIGVCSPALKDRDSAPAIAYPSRILWIGTALDHAHPGVVRSAASFSSPIFRFGLNLVGILVSPFSNMLSFLFSAIWMCISPASCTLAALLRSGLITGSLNSLRPFRISSTPSPHVLSVIGPQFFGSHRHGLSIAGGIQ